MSDYSIDLTIRSKRTRNSDARKNVLEHVKGVDEKTVKTILKKYGW